MRALAIAVLWASAACAGPGRSAPPPAPAPAPTPAPAAPPAPRAHAAAGLPSWIGARFEKTSTRVLRVIPGAPAERGGLRDADEVISVDGQPVTRAADIIERIQGAAPGVAITLVVQRAAARRTLTLTPEPRPEMMDVVRQALVGKPAPAFAGERISGSYPAALAELKGQVIVVDFWATWCGPCAMTLPRLAAWQAAYGARGLRIVGLTSEELPDITAFLADHPLAYTIARDPGGKAAADYLLQGVPMLVVIDRAGVVRDVFLGAGNFAAIEAAIKRLL